VVGSPPQHRKYVMFSKFFAPRPYASHIVAPTQPTLPTRVPGIGPLHPPTQSKPACALSGLHTDLCCVPGAGSSCGASRHAQCARSSRLPTRRAPPPDRIDDAYLHARTLVKYRVTMETSLRFDSTAKRLHIFAKENFVSDDNVVLTMSGSLCTRTGSWQNKVQLRKKFFPDFITRVDLGAVYETNADEVLS